jgi:1,4-dihydroxy-2-naphthoyl-CoA hydrolase
MSEFDLEAISALARDGLPGLIGIEWADVRMGYAHGFVRIERKHFAPNGFVHAGTLVTLADSACGYGCMASRPEGAVSFTTIELKTNFLGAAREGRIDCVARLVHGGRTTQVWDAEVKREDGRTIAVFRCTQLLIYQTGV